MKKGLIIIILLVLVVLGTGIFYYRPSAVAARAVQKLADAKTAAFKSEISIKSVTAQGRQNDTVITLDGVYDKSNVQGKLPFMQSKFGGEIKTQGLTLNISGEARLLDQMYVHIDQAPPVLPALVQLENKWIAIPRSEALQTADTSKASPFTEVKWSGFGSPTGQMSLHYTAKATSTAVTGLLNNVASIIGTTLTPDQLKGIADNVTQAGNIPVDLWVSPVGNQINQISGTIPLPNQSSFSLKLSFSDENKLVNIAKPEGAQTLQQLSQPSAPQASPAAK